MREAYTEPTRAPDVIVMDVRMPKVSGLGLLAAILTRALEDTDHPHHRIRRFLAARRAAALGANVVLDKPFELELHHPVARVARSPEDNGAPASAIA
ncbi:MAG: hypothetical protein U0235_17105 [Polyangiaceae bacterium]